MRIGIDARMMGKGFGLARYIEQLVLHLQKEDQKNEYVLFLKREAYDTFIPAHSNFKKVLVDIPWYSFGEQIRFPLCIRKEKIDCMHFPHFNVPLLYRRPFIVTIHDLIMFHYPRTEASTHGPLVYWIKDRVHRLVVKNAVRRAKHILVTSEYTKHDVHHTLLVPLEKMTVTYQAPFEPCLESVSHFDTLAQKYSLTKPYILYVGAAYPHKNLEGLVSAWKLFEKKYGTGYQLVLAGKPDYFYTNLEKTSLQNVTDVKYVGFVFDNELSSLYKNARVFVFPSLYEGFGLPPLEAMTYTVPVVSSNKSCLPEVLGDAAIYCDPQSPEALADALYQGLTNEEIRLKLAQNSIKVLSLYSWTTLAKQTLACYTREY